MRWDGDLSSASSAPHRNGIADRREGFGSLALQH